jgi:hypothetical protein
MLQSREGEVQDSISIAQFARRVATGCQARGCNEDEGGTIREKAG